MTIELPLPSQALSPNARVHWAKLAHAKKTARSVARIRTLQALDGAESRPVFRTYRLQFHFKTNRKRDDDNWAAACKAYRDGIADALLVDDHTLSLSEAPEMLVDRQNPRLIITLS